MNTSVGTTCAIRGTFRGEARAGRVLSGEALDKKKELHECNSLIYLVA